MIPKIQETKASSASPRTTNAKRSLRSRGLVRFSGSGGPGGLGRMPRRFRSRLPPQRLLALADRLLGLLALACLPGLLLGVPLVGRARAPAAPALRPSPFAESCSGPESMIQTCARRAAFVSPVSRGDLPAVTGLDGRPTTHSECLGSRRKSGGKSPFQPGGESSIGPVTPPPASRSRGETLRPVGAVDVLPEGRLAEQLGEGRAAAAQARRRPDQPGHPPRPLRGADEAARFPGRGPPGGLDHRRLHGAGRRPEWPRRHPARAHGRSRSRRTHTPTRSRPSRSSTAIAPSCAATASGSTCPRRSSSTWSAGSPSPGCSSATTSPSGWPKRSRSRRWSCSTRCCRATTRWRSTPTSSSAARDQKFNLLFGRDVQASYGRPPQSILTMPILPGHRRRSGR